jgi:hypothetical protein
MSMNARAWYTMPGDDDTLSPADLDHAFYDNYFPHPYTGYAGRPITLEQAAADRAEGRTCVRLLGDSTIATSGICQDLEDLLNGAGWNARVHNAGVIAANTTMMLSSVVHRVLDARPDFTIVVGGGIDVLTPLRFDPRPGFPHTHALSEVMFEHFYDHAQSSVWLNRPPLTVDRLRGSFLARIDLLRVQYGHLSPQWEVSIVDAFRRAVGKLLDVAGAARLKTAFVLSPLLTSKTTLTGTETQALPPARTRAYLERVYGGFARIVGQEIAQRSGDPNIRVADLHALFADDKEEMFYDIIHWNLAGRTRLAKSLFDLLQGWR